MLQKSLRSLGIRFKNLCEFWSGLGRGSGGAPWRNEGPMMQGRRSQGRLNGQWPRNSPGPLMRGPDRKVVPTERSLVAQSLSVISSLLSFNTLYQYVVPASSNDVQKQSFGIHSFYTYKCLRAGLSV